MTETAPRLAVLMTVYNGGVHFGAAVESLLNQTYRQFELHIVNDGSTDDTGRHLDAIALKDHRVRAYHKSNSGIVDSLNSGLDHIKTELIARADADDISLADRFEKQIDFLDSNPDVVAISGRARQIDENGRDLGTYTRTDDPENPDETAVPAREPYLMQPFLMLRTSALSESGGYRPFPVSEDSDLYWRLRGIGRLSSLDVEFGQYRLNSKSISSRSVEAGRLMCACSQLAALSAQRRGRGETDINVSPSLSDTLRSSLRSLDAIDRAVASQMTDPERRWFRAAISAKLLELAAYRPFEPSREDTMFISESLRDYWPGIGPKNRVLIRRVCSGTAARLIVAGQFNVSAPLLHFSSIGPTFIRLCARMIIPKGMRSILRRMLSGGGRAASIK